MFLTASYIDAHVGNRMRQRRESLGISQGRLGRHLGLTFSQIQKYEKGSNRIGAGRLYQIGQYLDVTLLYFFDGLEPAASSNGPRLGDEAHAADLARLTEAFAAITDPETRKSVLALVASISTRGMAPVRRQGEQPNGH